MRTTSILRKAALFTSAFALFVGLNGCQTSAGVDSILEEVDLDGAEFAVLEMDDELAAVEDASLTKSMSLNTSSPEDYQTLHENRKKDRIKKRLKRQGLHLGRILRQLELTEEQMGQIKEFLRSFRDCVKPEVIAFREAARPIIEEANAQRRAIKTAFEEGEITRSEAEEQIRALNEAKRTQLREAAESLGTPEAVCACKQTLLDSISGILDAESQQPAFDEWVAGLQGPCFTDAEN